MTEQHPITPPPELVQQWRRTAPHPSNEHEHYYYITLCAAQWGADQELEACCAWLKEWQEDKHAGGIENLRDARRPKPPSLKGQAIAELEKVDMLWDTTEFGQETLLSLDTIRRALEALPDA
jgi:hypothetical protein